jgi:hypothetical protein
LIATSNIKTDREDRVPENKPKLIQSCLTIPQAICFHSNALGPTRALAGVGLKGAVGVQELGSIPFATICDRFHRQSSDYDCGRARKKYKEGSSEAQCHRMNRGNDDMTTLSEMNT